MENNTPEFPMELRDQKSSFKLIKNTKGYGWEIKVYDEDIQEIMRKTKIIEDWAKETYGEKE